MSNKQFDASKAEQFAGTLVDTFNKASLTLMISLGHRVKIFDSMAGCEPLTSQQIADKANLYERYVREWLGAMVTGNIIEYDADSKTYYLPDEHAAFLTRLAGADNMALFAQYIPAVAQVEDDILHCFKNGGGVSYDKYHRFYLAMAEDQSVINTFSAQFLPSTSELEKKLENGISVLDLGCGSGGLLVHLASHFPKSRFTGIDFSELAIVMANKDKDARGLSNVDFHVKDLSDYEVTAPEKAYDFIMTIDAIHDQHKPMSVLRGIHKALKDDGNYLMVDINGTGYVHQDEENPLAPFLYSISCMHCVAVSIGQGGEGLGAMWGEEKIRDYLTKAGFISVECKSFSTDPINNWYMVSK